MTGLTLMQALAAVLILYLAGRSALAALGLQPRPLEREVLALLIGPLLAGAVYALLAVFGLRTLAPVPPLLVLVVAAFRVRTLVGDVGQSISALSKQHLLPGLALLLALFPLLVLPMYDGNLAPVPGGGLRFHQTPEVVQHVSIVNELRRTLPPGVPFQPGAALGYHYGVDLIGAALVDGFQLPVAAVVLGLLPALFVATTALAGYALARVIGLSRDLAALVMVLVFFGEDLSFVPGLLTGADVPWAIQFFSVPTVASLYMLNPMLPALGLVFGALLALSRDARGDGPGWAALGVLLLGVLASVKVFASALVIAGVCFAGVIRLVRARDTRPLRLALVAAALGVAMVAPMATAGTVRFAARVESWPYVPTMLFQMGLFQSWLGHRVAAFAGSQAWSVGDAAAFLLLALPLYLVGALGVRLVGLPRMFRDLMSSAAWVEQAIAASVLASPVLMLAGAVTPTGYVRGAVYNEAVWFFVLGKQLAWLPVARTLAAWSPAIRARGVAVCVALALPSAIQYLAFHVRHDRVRTIGVDELAATAPLASALGDVVFAREDVAEDVLVLTRCRAPSFRVSEWLFATPAELTRNRETLDAFWADWGRGRLRSDILARYSAGWLLVDLKRDPGAAAPASLRHAAQSGSFVLYRLERPGPRP
jgi:hypothetical protein